MAKSALDRARNAKRDEFYTQLEDVEQELDYYRGHFEGKVIYLNCDNPEYSAFWQYFSYNFDLFGLKKLIATHYVSGGSSYKYEYEHKNDTNEPKVVKTKLKGNGDFRSEECVELLEEADIVASNPPFSLWREYLAQLVEYEKRFIILGNMNAITYKDVFPSFKSNEIWFGHRSMNSKFYFEVPDDYEHDRVDDDGRRLKEVSACWYTNLEINKHYEDLELTRFYEGNEEAYPMYDNYDAIEVSRTREIPMDYIGVMGVPITFMDKYSPDQFEILGMAKPPNCFTNEEVARRTKVYENVTKYNKDGSTINGGNLNGGPALEISEPLKNKTYYKVDDKLYRAVYARILIVNKNPKV